MRLNRIILATLLSLLSACATAKQVDISAVEIAPGVVLTVPDRPTFGSRATAVQLVQAHYGERQEALQAVIESDAEHTTVIMTVPSGPRIMSIEWRYRSLATKVEPLAPKGLSPEHMLADMLTIYSSAAQLQTMISGGEVISDADGTRRIVKDGAPVIAVTLPIGQSGANPWNGPATLENLAYHYSLNITSQSTVP